MNTQTTTSTAAPESATETAANDKTAGTSTEQTTNAQAGAETTKDQAAPGGAKGEFSFTWTLRPLTARKIAKIGVFAVLYVLTAYVLGYLIGLLGNVSFLLGTIVMFVSIWGMLIFSAFVLVPASRKIVDVVCDSSIAGWTKVKGWFKKAETVATAATEAAAEAAAEPAAAAA